MDEFVLIHTLYIYTILGTNLIIMENNSLRESGGMRLVGCVACIINLCKKTPVTLHIRYYQIRVRTLV